MKYLFNIFGGQKSFYFLLLLSINIRILLYTDKWTEGFGYFTVALYVSIVAGHEYTKYNKGKQSLQTVKKYIEE